MWVRCTTLLQGFWSNAIFQLVSLLYGTCMKYIKQSVSAWVWHALLVLHLPLPSFLSSLFTVSYLIAQAWPKTKKWTKKKKFKDLPGRHLMSCCCLPSFLTSHFSPFIFPFQSLLFLVAKKWQRLLLYRSVNKWGKKKKSASSHLCWMSLSFFYDLRAGWNDTKKCSNNPIP